MTQVLNADPKNQKTRKSTIAELGPNLPIGLVSASGELGTGLVARPWRLKEETELARIRSDNPEVTFTSYTAMILGTMLSRIGTANFDEIKDLAMRKIVIGQMYMPDVFYAYIWLRIQAIGPELKLKVKCPKCRLDQDFIGDLTTTEVVVPVDTSDLDWEYTLKTPITMRGRSVTGLYVGQRRWASLENMDVESGAKINTILNSVNGFVGGPVDPSTNKPIQMQLLSNDLDELTKYDLERLADTINERHLGPKMAVEIVCVKEKCGKTWETALDWRYDDFFSVSSV